jgi:hypothetical protein
MSDEMFNLLASKQGGIHWTCESCEASSARLEAAIRAVEIRVTNVEARMEANEAGVSKIEERLKRLENAMDPARIEKNIFEEMNEREEKKLNIVIYNLNEAGADVKDVEERRKWDQDLCNSIFESLKLEMTFEEVATFCRRVGPRGEDGRPLVVGLQTEDIKSTLLQNAKFLRNTRFNRIGISPDLTKKQREDELDIWSEVERRNKEELTEEDKAKNLEWAVVGKRGARILIKRTARKVQEGRRGRGALSMRGRGSTSGGPRGRDRQMMISRMEANRKRTLTSREEEMDQLNDVGQPLRSQQRL